ncbi:MAG: LamG domain-containing protein [Phycisphaerae bacterium]|nr:LamG domain-containing protein [Phycisphaerae bacterium]
MTQRTSYLPTLLFLVPTAIGISPSSAVEPVRATEQMTGPWQLFIDDYLIASKQNVVRRYHAFHKHPDNPLIVVDKPWEAHVVAACTVLPGEDGTGFRMWYYCWTEDKSSRKGRGSFMCYAVSKDGLKWEKPNLGLYEWSGDGTKNNNIVPHGPGHVMHTPWEKDPQKRYQGVGGMYHAFSSPDGLNWKQESTEKIVSGGDTSHFYWDPHTRRFRCTVKGGGNGCVSGLRRRVVGFSETTDPTKFPPLRMVMAPDDVDDLWCKPETVQRTHFYACPVLPYETMYIGLLQIYRAEEPEGYFHGPLWLELVSSRDGVHWLREEPDTSVRHIYALDSVSRPPLLDIGKYREFDRGMVFAPTPLLVGDELWAFYTGYDEEHDLLPYRSAIGLAKLRKDGFASLDADELPGEVLTKRFENVDGPLQVNYHARGGSIRVELIGADGQVIAGYGRDDCEPLTGDAIRGTVSWKTKKELPSGGPVRFRFILDHGRLYSFMAGQNAKLINEPPVPVLQALYTFEGNTEAWSDMLGGDGLQALRNLGTSTLDHKNPDPAFGQRSLVVGSPWRPWNRVEILGTDDLGRHFTLAAMAKNSNNKHARLFSAYNGNFPVSNAEFIFDFDPSGRMLNGLRLVCKGLEVESDAVTFADGKYHHLAVVYDDGCVTFYLDGKSIGQQWIPGGEPVKLARNLLIGEDAHRGSDEQLMGNVDDVLVLGRAMSAEEIASLAKDGATAFFAKADKSALMTAQDEQDAARSSCEIKVGTQSP